MPAPKLDSWGREKPLRAPQPAPVAAAAPAPGEAVILAELAALRARVLRLEGRERFAAKLDAVADAAPSLHAKAYGWVTRLAVVVADEWGVAADELTNRYRAAETILRPRFVLIWLLREASDYSLPHIGRLVQRDHSSVLYGFKRVEAWRKGDEAFRYLTDQLLVIARRLRAESAARLRADADAGAPS